jgi:hypothetical protein
VKSESHEKAIFYAQKYGWHIFPCAPLSKNPAIPKEEGGRGLHDATIDIAQIDAWWNAKLDANIGLNCGASGLIALDFDVAKETYAGHELFDHLMAEFPTVTQETQSGGYHLLYRQPDGVKLGNSRGAFPTGVDCRGHGGYIVLAPSILKPELQGLDIKDDAKRMAKQKLYRTGHGYRWMTGRSPNDCKIAALPEFVLAILQAKPATATTPATVQVNGVGSKYAEAALNGELNKLLRTGEGSRNDQLNKSGFVLGQLVGAGVLDETTVRNGLESAAMAVGLGERETLATIRSGVGDGMARPRAIPERRQNAPADSGDNGDSDNPEASGRKPKQADILFGLVRERAELFTGQDGDKYASVPVDSHWECYAISTRAFRDYLDGLYFAAQSSIPSAQAKQDAIGLLSFFARENRRNVYYRVGRYDERIYIDLGTEDWSAIEVDAQGWRIVLNHPVAFRRSSATKPLPLPVKHDNLELLNRHVNIAPSDWPLFKAWLVSSAIPGIPTPILTFPNEQGTGKTTNTNRVKALLDPGRGRVMPREARDLMVMADNNWTVAFDNVSSIPSEIADVLCQIVTGGEYAKRANYADKDEAVMQVQRPIIINGIGNITSDRADLMDRSLIIRPPVIPVDRRVDERTSDARFEQDRPRIFGALLHEISRALTTLPTVLLAALPRMADFAKVGYALYGQTFLDAYTANIENAAGNAADSSPLVEFVTKLVIEKGYNGRWEGTATRLLDELNSLDGADKHQRSRDWPSSNRKIKNAMQRIAPLLRAVGVDVVQSDQKMGSYFVITARATQSEGLSLL